MPVRQSVCVVARCVIGSRGVIRVDSVTRDGVGRAVAEIRAGIVHPELRVVENVKNLSSEFHAGRFVNLDVRNSVMSKFKRLGLFIALRPALPKVNPRGAAKAEALPSAGPKLREFTAPSRSCAMDVAHDIREGPDRTDSARDTSIVRHGDSEGAVSGVNHAVRDSALYGRNAGNLPAPEHTFHESIEESGTARFI